MWFAQLGMLLAIPLTIRFFLPIYSKLDIDTAYHYLELRFGSKGLRVLGAVMFIIYQVGRMSIIMYLPCMVLGSLTGISVKCIDYCYGCDRNHLLLYRWIKIRTLDRLYSGFRAFDRCYICIGIPSGTH